MRDLPSIEARCACVDRSWAVTRYGRRAISCGRCNLEIAFGVP
jgi:hypothetical protein